MAVRARVLVGEGPGSEKRGAIAAVQRAVLASKEVSAAFFVHGGRADRAVGFVCRHFGKQALTRKILKPMFQNRRSHCIIQCKIHAKRKQRGV